jgi:hypothetical protein
MEKLELKHLAPYLPYGILMWSEHNGKWKLQPRNFPNNWEVSESFKPILRPLSDLVTDTDTLYEIALIADCHFKEMPQVSHYHKYEEDEYTVCAVVWADGRNSLFEISWEIEYSEGLDKRNGNINMCLGNQGMVFNTNRIYEYLYLKNYDIERLIDRGLAKDINTL